MRHILAILTICLCAPALALPATNAPVMEREPDGMVLRLASGELRIQVVSDAVVRVAFSRSTKFFGRASIDRVALPPATTAFKIR